MNMFPKRSMLTRRPAKGRDGTPVTLTANYFPVHLSDADLRIVQYRICFDPPLSSHIFRRKIKSLLQENIFKEFVAYDGDENLYMPRKASELAGRDPLRFLVCPFAGGRVHQMTLSKISELSVSDLIAFCRGDPAVKLPENCLQALDAVLRDSASWVYCPLGKHIFLGVTESSKHSPMSLREGTPPRSRGGRDSIWRRGGVYLNLCAVEDGLALQMDSSAMTFHGRTCVSHYLQGRGVQVAALLSDRDMCLRAKRYLAGLFVDCAHQFHARRYRVVGISSRPAKENELFDRARQREYSVFQSFRAAFPALAVDPAMPCLILAGTAEDLYVWDDSEPFLVPMDACFISGGQPFYADLAPKEEEDLRALKGSNPSELLCAIMDGCSELRALLFSRSFVGKKLVRPIRPFGLGLGDDVIRTPGRVIGRPALWNVRSEDWTAGRWNATKVYKSGRVLSREEWGILIFRPAGAHSDVAALVDRIIRRGRSLGVECFGSLDDGSTATLDAALLDNSKELHEALQPLKSGPFRDAVFLFCVVDDTADKRPLPYLGNFLRLSETAFGWLTKCFYASQAAGAEGEEIGNIALTINAKLGGTTTAVRPDFGAVFRSVFRDQPVILFGTDLVQITRSFGTKPRGVSSYVAAIVASVDWPHPSQYCSRVINVRGKAVDGVEIHTSVAIGDLVEAYAANNGGVMPERAVFFRYRAGDVEHSDSEDEDLEVMRLALKSVCPGLKLTWIDAWRGHHTRLFAQDDTAAADVVHVEPGTVVDSGLVHPWQWDFYLASHPSTYSRSPGGKPTYYRVVLDENEFTADDMEKFVYYLCHTFASKTETTETVPPLYYVKLAVGHATSTNWVPLDRPARQIQNGMYFLN